MSKITLATFKKFVRENKENLLIRVKSRFDGMVDGVIDNEDKCFASIRERSDLKEYTLGIFGVWLVKSSGDYFTPYNKDGLTGIEVYNCCGTFILAKEVRA